jgi:hypothetical protein
MQRSLLHSVVALVLACTYFAFRTEIYEEEYDANHHIVSTEPAINASTLNWETFDKENAPKAFVFCAEVVLQILYKAPPPVIPIYTVRVEDDLVRDKSPPLA